MLTLIAFIGLAEAKKAPKAPPPPPVGWHREEGWKGDCYYPPDFATKLESDRKLARQQALEAMKSQWLGGRDDGVSLDENVVDDVETTLLGRPVQIEAVSKQNLDQCVAFMKGGDLEAWRVWIGGARGRLTAGECMQPLTYTVFDYLDIQHPWQRPVPLCKGDKAHIWGTVSDKYRVSADGDWITVTGTSERATGSDYPCNIEGCMVGMLIAKFTSDSGVETVFPVGAGVNYEAPENGTLTYQINDYTWFDNKWFKSSTIEDKAAVTIEPAQ